VALRIAVPSNCDSGLDGPISEHFGHTPCFVLIDIEGDAIKDVKVIRNPHYLEHRPGVVPEFLAEKGVNLIICRGMGWRAQNIFQQYGIKVITGAEGRIRDAIRAYLEGRLVSREYKPARRWHEERFKPW